MTRGGSQNELYTRALSYKMSTDKNTRMYIITLTLGVNFVLLNQFLHHTQLAPLTCCTQKLGFVLIITHTATAHQVEGNTFNVRNTQSSVQW